MSTVRVILFGGMQDGGLYDVPLEPDGTAPPKIRIAAPELPAAEVMQDMLGGGVDILIEGFEPQPDLIYIRATWPKGRKNREALPVPYIHEDINHRMTKETP